MYRFTHLNSIKHYGQICCFPTLLSPLRKITSDSRGVEESDAPQSGIKGGKNTYERKTLPPELCTNAVTLTCESSANGGVCDVYLVGTLHCTPKSRQEVKAVIDFLKPQVVFLELCYIRDLKKLELESEFHVAYEEAMKYGGKVVLGDRPQHTTQWRTIAKMTLLDVTMPARLLLRDPFFLIRDPEIHHWEKHFPSLAETILHERDQYMSATLLEVAREHNTVVAVMGKNHLPGIQKNWKQPIEVKPLLQLPSLGIIRRILFVLLYWRLPSADGL